MDFADRIRELRKLKKLSLDEVSQRCGVSKSMISKIERKEKMPTLQIAARISEALDTTLSSLLAESSTEELVVTKEQERVVFCDELTGFRRECFHRSGRNPNWNLLKITFLLVPPPSIPAASQRSGRIYYCYPGNIDGMYRSAAYTTSGG